jgi:hypothetical protein
MRPWRVNANDFSCERDASYIQLRCGELLKQYRGLCRAARIPGYVWFASRYDSKRINVNYAAEFSFDGVAAQFS